MRVGFSWKGRQYEAEQIARGAKTIRIGWLDQDVPSRFSDCVASDPKRPGWMTVKLPLGGPDGIAIEDQDAQSLIKKRQSEWAASQGIRLQKGSAKSAKSSNAILYTHSLHENLFEKLSAEVTKEFEQGDGRPLMGKKGSLPHFWALHNSDAIAANVFCYWKARDCSRVAHYLNIPKDGLANLTFEQKFRILPHGNKTAPNIDVAIQYAPGCVLDWVGIECKLTETYPAKRRHFFDEKYFVPGRWWDGLPGTRRLAESFRGDGRKTETTKRHLDRGQLIKHVLGLRNACRLKQTDPCRIKLIYLWYDVGLPEARLHEQEVEAFAAVLGRDGVQFQAMTWQHLIRALVEGEREQHPNYVDYLARRYL